MSINEVRYLPECGSTNAYVKEHFEEFGPVGAVYTTNQTAGRGRLGRSWLDAPHKGLYYTAVIRTDLVQPATLPLFASLAVCDALRERYRIDCQIKWPNDLLLNGKKIVGILCEVGPDGHSIVVGIGINVHQQPEDFTGEVADIATSLDLSLGGKVCRARLAAALLEEMDYLRREVLFTPERWLADYRAACLNVGRTVRLLQGDARETVQALRIDEQYGLVVRHEDGSVETVRSGEVSVRGLYGYTE